MVPIIVRQNGSELPHVAFFTKRDIRRDEELTFSYGTISADTPSDLSKKFRSCFCGSKNCKKQLPFEDV